MEKNTIVLNGNEVKLYCLSYRECVDALKGDDISEEDKQTLKDYIVKKFEYENCPRKGENELNVFARQFSDFVNGKCGYNYREVANLLAKDHRYLQQEMFHIMLAYIKILDKNYQSGLYDGRNEWSCTASHHMIEGLKNSGYPY